MLVFVPMFGDSFFTTVMRLSDIAEIVLVFVPMFGDSFFTRERRTFHSGGESFRFRPHVWGFFFHLTDPFQRSIMRQRYSFRPHVWGFFFHGIYWKRGKSHQVGEVFVPMFGDSFFTLLLICSRLSSKKFSSPCLGILFSQQAWGAPRGGLSIALLRRGFPIDWNSHYFHPLTYCFLRFHAYRRGFLLL